jgi:small-conductance mechanosensitive channel
MVNVGLASMTSDFWTTGLDLVNPGTWVGASFWALIIGLLAWLVGEAVRLVVHHARRDGQGDQAGITYLGQLARGAVWLGAFLFYASLVPALEKFRKPDTFATAAFYAVVVGLVAWLTGGFLRLAMHRVLEKRGESVDQTAVRFLDQLVRVGVWVFAFVSYAHVIPALRGLGTAWLTSAGVAAVVVGMAAQNTLGNLIAGVSLVLYRPFRMGDQLQVSTPGGLETGIVENISLGYTILRAGDERRLVIPNSLMASQTIINLSMSSQPVPCEVLITLEHDADVDKARQILLEVARQHPQAPGTPTCRITDLSGAGVTVTLTAWAANSLAAPDLKCDLLEGAKKRLDQAGIPIHRDCGFAPPAK